jgi:NAD(P)-dependent dehydrogenase (short-subunit alcohol dehydrogenase family)
MKTTTEEFDSIMRINGSGTFSMVRETAQSMIGTGTPGAIVVLSSVAAKEARLNYLPYNASKLAVLHIMWSFAELLGPNGISVNAIAPGPVNTPMWAQFAKDSGPGCSRQARRATSHAPVRRTRRSRPRHPFPCRPDNRYITSVSLDVAGGAHLGMGT